MKNYFYLTFALCFLCLNNLFSQDAIVSIDHVTKSSGEIAVPLNVDFSLEDVCSFGFFIHFDEDHLTFKGAGNLALFGIGVSPAYSNSPIQINWFSINATNFEGKLLDLIFEYHGGDSEITFGFDVNEMSEVSDCDAIAYDNVTFNNGSISLIPPVPLTNWAIALGFVLIAIFIGLKRGKFF